VVADAHHAEAHGGSVPGERHINGFAGQLFGFPLEQQFHEFRRPVSASDGSACRVAARAFLELTFVLNGIRHEANSWCLRATVG
jgi:hypothetical protein